jgi:hypothetical protein
METTQTTDTQHVAAIQAAIAAAFADTDCTMIPQDVKAIADAEWEEVKQRNIAAIFGGQS